MNFDDDGDDGGDDDDVGNVPSLIIRSGKVNCVCLKKLPKKFSTKWSKTHCNLSFTGIHANDIAQQNHNKLV